MSAGVGTPVPLTATQVARLARAGAEGRGADISFSKTQLGAMKKGGIIPLAAIIPALAAAGKAAALGASAAAGSAALKKLISSGAPSAKGGRLRLARR